MIEDSVLSCRSRGKALAVGQAQVKFATLVCMWRNLRLVCYNRRMAADQDAHRVAAEDADWDLGPQDPDYDLAEAAGYAEWEPRRSLSWPQWLIIALALLVIVALLLPIIIRLA